MLEDEQLNIVKIKSEVFESPLYAAVKAGCHEIVRILIDRGTPVNVERSPVPLEAAIENLDDEMVRLLLEPQYGHINAGYLFERSIVMSLISNQAGVARLMLERNEEKLSGCRYVLREGLRATFRQGMIESVELLLDNGGDFNEYLDQTGCFVASLFRQAAWTGQEEALSLLLARGANPYGRKVGIASMCAAAWGGHVDVARMLLDAGVQLEPLGG